MAVVKSAPCSPPMLWDRSEVVSNLAGAAAIVLALACGLDVLCWMGPVAAILLACTGCCAHLAGRGARSRREVAPAAGCGGRGCSKGAARQGCASEAAEVAERRAGRYGAWKYCGLRPDPFATDAPPSYAHKGDPGLALPELRPGEREKLSELRGRLGDLATAGARTDEATVLRYLRARGGSVDKAEKMFREWVALRAKSDLDRLEEWNLDAYEHCLGSWWVPCGLLRHGLGGEPVQYERVGATDLRRLVDGLGVEALKKTDLVHCARMQAALEEDALRRGVPLAGCIVVFDLAGLARDQISLSIARGLANLLEARDLLLPELVDRMLIVNASPVFAGAWNMLSYLLPPATRAKVQIASAAGTRDLLLRNIALENLPGFLGGELCIDGDPECRCVVAPGGSIPEEVLLEFETLVRKGHATKQGCSKPLVPGCATFVSCCLGRDA